MKTFGYDTEYIFSDEATVLKLAVNENLTIEEAVKKWFETLDGDEYFQVDKVYYDIINYLTRKYDIY